MASGGGAGLALRAAGLYFGAMDRVSMIKEAALMKLRSRKPTAGKIFSFVVATIDGAEKSLGAFKGHPLLIVNTASLCGYTPQYASLEKLHRNYQRRGLKILAFPSDNFGHQEPGTDAEIKEFCRARYAVSFELFSKINVKGDRIHPLYVYLTKESEKAGAIAWNFTKFLVDAGGRVVERFGPAEDPLSPSVTGRIEELLSSSKG